MITVITLTPNTAESGLCPICQEPGGFHSYAKHAEREVPRELLLASGWQHVISSMIAENDALESPESALSAVRLLDLALAYALDDPSIHDNDPNSIRVLREMHNRVLVEALLLDDSTGGAEDSGSDGAEIINVVLRSMRNARKVIAKRRRGETT